MPSGAFRGFLAAFFAAGFAVPAFAGERVVILALGDSTTAGTPFFSSPAEAPPDGRGDPRGQYAYWIEKARPQWRVVNLGVNGERTDQIRRRLGPALDAWKPRALVLLGGVNDLYQDYPAEHPRENLEAMYREASSRGVEVVACTILPYDGQGQLVRERMQETNRWIEAYSREHGLGFCDTAGAAADPADPSRLGGSPDGLHPDIEHYRRMGEALIPAIEAVLRSKIKDTK
ncbi:MAG TPA: GDSL-type esterase/lipase family protein [Candidatus Eisenbacteria bacterium]|jgi:lysophospholipase L1-like esterase|nr:GDSL-type esterase/lipase family protein [Candidatus Eisenbacteria bacterium]